MSANQQRDRLAETGHHPLYRRHESKRAYPRVKISMPVQIGVPGGRVVCGRMYNLSPDGLQVRCDPQAARLIHPDAGPIAEGAGPEMPVVLRIRAGQELRTVVLRCRLTYLVAEKRSEIILGLGFVNLAPSQQAAIDELLAASLAPV